MRLDKFLIGFLVFSLIITVGVLMISDVNTEYELNKTTDQFDDLSGVYNVSGEMYSLSQDMKEETLEADIEGSDQSWESTIKGGYSSLRLISNSFRLVAEVANALAETIGIPVFFVTTLMVVITILIVFSIVYLVFGSKG